MRASFGLKVQSSLHRYTQTSDDGAHHTIRKKSHKTKHLSPVHFPPFKKSELSTKSSLRARTCSVCARGALWPAPPTARAVVMTTVLRGREPFYFALLVKTEKEE